ncbi:MAG: 30S ribosomal protein S15 [Flavobacteriales bacterium]|nr:30S ribosomal protein S15 [Flavobacteriales bacterium]PWM11207.1 MAG: 30S ribosomal protein S15 [Flavobacteriales bacterium]
MYLTKEKKQEIFAQYGKSATDTGSSEGQIALFTYRINHLTEHLKKNIHDFNTERSLVKLVGKRRSLLEYLKREDIERYRKIVEQLGLRK